MDTQEIRQKSYLIVGGSSGIGLTVAKQLADKGNRVILVSSNQEKLREALLCLVGQRHKSICCDLCNVENVKQIYTYLLSENIRLNGMIYCSGIAPLCFIKDNTTELMQKVFNVNVFSFIELVKFFQRKEISYTGARVVAVTSITARGAGYRQTLYGASKAALISAIKLMAKELLDRDIRVNCISPGVTDTPLLKELKQKTFGLEEKIKSTQPLGIISAKSISSAIIYLLNEGADFLTGTEWVLDGGASLK